jgi:hydrogenase maturation protein HypF
MGWIVHLSETWPMPVEGRRIEVEGVVQGVGFRPWVWRLARERGLSGRVLNHARGVTIDAFGPGSALAGFEERLRAAPPPAAVITALHATAISPQERANDGFVIVESEGKGRRRVSIPPDLATCAECAEEVLDPRNRRYRYPFTNCTSCGPRLTIARDVPYDRPLTTMSAFRMCARCQEEYDDPRDRRFHAQPNACPECGPRLRALTPAGDVVPGDPIRAAAAALRSGLTVAVKGIGGFHLACDAFSGAAVCVLRARKQREEKPFAVMVRDLASADAMAELSEAEAVLLTGVERPIVLVRRRPGCPLTAEIAPGSPLVGLMLPYSPLHLLLLREAGHALVMTSGNLSDEPMVTTNEEARDRLRDVADLFLVHDREIETRCDDSVARVIAGRPVLLRRSRGYVPRPVRLARGVVAPVLACGGHLKNAFCLAEGTEAWLGPHVGDLDTMEALRSLTTAIERMERFLGIAPEVIAHDLHPDYASTTYAQTRSETLKVGVQHHHAHVAAAMAEHGLEGPAIGVAYDGTGYGTDGTAWGGELLLAEYGRFERLATFRPLPLPGGETAVREVWRLALALLDDAFGEEAPLDRFPVFAGDRAAAVEVVRQMMRRGFNVPRAHGVGRYFDAVAALVLGRATVSFEGQAALEWNAVADRSEAGAYGYLIEREQAPWQLDLRPTVRQVVRDVLAGEAAAAISARFHNTLASATALLVREAVKQHGPLPVVLTGGCFQNDLLAEGVLGELSGLDVRLHAQVPPGDGGLALGQALVADALVRGRE